MSKGSKEARRGGNTDELSDTTIEDRIGGFAVAETCLKLSLQEKKAQRK